MNGAAQRLNDVVFWSVNSHTMACNYLEQVYEYLLARSVDRVGNKGITTVLNDTDISTVRIAIGKTAMNRFTEDIMQADHSINEPISITKLTDLNTTTQNFIDNYSTHLKFMQDFVFPDQVELIGFETKKSKSSFIKLRNKSSKSIEIPSSLFLSQDYYIDGNQKYLLNGIKLEDEFFEKDKLEFNTDVSFYALRYIKKTLHTLEDDLPTQTSKRSEKVKERQSVANRVTELGPFEIATFKISFE